MKKEIWANCENCNNFTLTDTIQTCNNFDLIGLPEPFAFNTNKKCCSAFQADLANVNSPDYSKMEYGVLYYYNTKATEKLIYDIDFDDNGKEDNLIASGTVELNNYGGSTAVCKWNCRIDPDGIRSESDVLEK
ncbi:MAG: hypothetical protein ACI8ZM_003639 [Crocinitomix sp.]|jgi:hypothetical protein